MTTSDAERNFHLWMAVLLVTALVAERPLRAILPGFDPPAVTLVPLALCLTWLAGTFQRRLRELTARLQMLEEQRALDQRRMDELTRALALVERAAGNRGQGR